MSYYGASGSSTLNRPTKTQSKRNNSFHPQQQMPVPFTTSIMNNFKVSKECIVKQPKHQQLPTNIPSSDIDLGNFSKESYEADANKVKQKSSKNNKKIIGFSWSAITNNQKGKTTNHSKVMLLITTLFIIRVLKWFSYMQTKDQYE